MNRFVKPIAASVASLLVAGCSSIEQHRYDSSLEHIALRKEQAAYDLSFKEQYFSERVPLDAGMVPQNSRGEAHIDSTMQYLAALAVKQHTDPNEKDSRRIAEMVQTFSSLTAEALSANKLSQLLFAYSFMQEREDVQAHASEISAMLFENDLELPGTHSDLRVSKMKLSRSRVLDTLVLAEGLKKMAPSKEADALLQECIRANYLKKIRNLEIDAGIVKVPTHSSDWLFMIRLGALMNFNPSPEYKIALERHYVTQSDEDNALFEAIAQLNGIPSQDPLEILNEYPLLNTNREILHRTQRMVWVKNGWKHQVKEPLPVYARGTHYNVWKKNPFHARENLGNSGEAQYFGIDFLLPYYLAQLSEKQQQEQPTKPVALIVEDKKHTRDRLVKIYEQQGYHVLQAGTLAQAKSLAPQAEVILTDMDLSIMGGGFTAKNDGLDFLKWLRKKIDAGALSPESVTLHSTVLNEGDSMHFLAKGVKKKVKELGFHAQPKTTLLH